MQHTFLKTSTTTKKYENTQTIISLIRNRMAKQEGKGSKQTRGPGKIESAVFLTRQGGNILK